MEAGSESMCRKLIKQKQQTNPNSESERNSPARQRKQNNNPKDGFEEEGYPQNIGIMVMKGESKQQAMKGSGKTGNNST